MKIKLISYIFFQYIVLMLLLATTVISGVAQSTTKDDSGVKQDVSSVDDRTSLQGLTEAILIDGQPALRILSRGNGSTEIRLQKRNNETVLIFNVVKLLGKPGTLNITKAKIVFNPDSGNKNYFSIEKKLIKKSELVEKSKFFAPTSFVKIVTPDDSKLVTLRFTNDSGNNKEYAIPGNNFLLKTISNFDDAVTEFQKLTASVLQNNEDEEEVEVEETEANINDKYDRFKDITLVSTSKMLVRGNKRSIHTYAEYTFAGKAQKKPEKVSLYFYASAARPLFREDDLELNFLVDGKRVSLGDLSFADEEKTKTSIKQTIVVTMPYETFTQIADGKKVEFQIGNLEYKLTDIHLEAFRKLLTYKIEE